MKNFTFPLILSLAFLPVAFQSPGDKLDTVFRQINQEADANSQAYETLRQATSTIGHRLTGSANGKKAEEFAFALLQKYGFKPRYVPFEVIAWSRDTVSLEVVPARSDNFHAIKTVSLALSPVQADVKAVILDCGNGMEEDFDRLGEQVKGKIALMNIGIFPADPKVKNLHRSEKTALAIRHGAAGVIMANGVKGGVLLTGTASVTGSLIPVPAVCISVEDGEMLRDILRSDPTLTAHIRMKNRSGLIKARNITATIPGKGLSKEKILVGGHLDSWDLATGATDNGLGSFEVMEIARIFKKLNLQPRRTVEFVLFMGEEQGLLGSKALINRMIKTKDLQQVQYMINLDMATNAIGFNAGGREEMADFYAKTGEKIKAIDPFYQNKNENSSSLHSDHQGFMLEGIPVAMPVSLADPEMYQCYHADCDDIRWAKKDYMNRCAKFTAMMLYALADADTIPAKRLSRDQTRQFLIRQGLKQPLKIANDWRFNE
jgi:carboxypeptidase Q